MIHKKYAVNFDDEQLFNIIIKKFPNFAYQNSEFPYLNRKESGAPF